MSLTGSAPGAPGNTSMMESGAALRSAREFDVKNAVPLPISALYRKADLSALSYETTSDIAPLKGLVGQKRAEAALSLGLSLNADGFNLFVAGGIDEELRKTLRDVLEMAARARPSPSDWVYVYNFTEPHKPSAIELPQGRAPEFRDAMRDLIQDLKIALPAAYEREDYQNRRASLEETVRKKQVEALSQLGEKASRKSLSVIRTPMGFGIVPTHNGEVVPPDEFHNWPEERRQQAEKDIQELEEELERIVRQMPGLEKELRDKIRGLNRETAKWAIGHSIEEVKGRLADLPKITGHLELVRENLIENVAPFIAAGGSDSPDDVSRADLFDRYHVNVLVTHDAAAAGAPVVEESHPTLVNLIGRAEYAARQGLLVTDFRLIKPGALHHANGGFLILDARNLLSEPFSWAALKRALRGRNITIEDVTHFMGLTGTITLEPDPIPLNIKIVLVGDRLLYYMLAELDPEFREHFKILADIDDDTDRNAQSEQTFAGLLSGIVARKNLMPVERAGIERLIEHASRLADSSDKLSLLPQTIDDIVTEAEYWSRSAHRSSISVGDIEKTLEERETRSARLKDRTSEAIIRGYVLIDTVGQAIGQVNGLSVYEMGGYRFGRPTRISARARPGSGHVLDIEREVKLGGPIHSKGVLILSGFLAGRYALDVPVSLSASLVFEQSYGGVEGDSASCAELCALLSALAQAPLRQDLAVTGSINQHGHIQAIGGVNEKIEGFFDVCKARGLTRTQGVIIPSANVKNLMLRADVVEACAKGDFAVFAIATIDEAMALLTGIDPGLRDAAGRFPDGSINARIEAQLRAFAAVRREFTSSELHDGKADKTAPGIDNCQGTQSQT